MSAVLSLLTLTHATPTCTFKHWIVSDGPLFLLVYCLTEERNGLLNECVSRGDLQSTWKRRSICGSRMMRCLPAMLQTLTMRPPSLINGSIASHTALVPTKLMSKVVRAS